MNTRTALAAVVAVLTVGAVAIGVVPAAAGAADDVIVDHGFTGGDISAGIRGRRPGSTGPGGGGRRASTPVDDHTRMVWEFRQLTQELYCDGTLTLGFGVGVQNTAAGDFIRMTDPTCQDPEPTPPPPAPSYGELRAHTPIPPPSFAITPPTPGLTGLETTLDFTGDVAARSVTVDLRGYRVTTRARFVTVQWRITGPVDARVGGASTRHTFERKGHYTVSCTVTWAGTATVSGYGITREVNLGTRAITASRPYAVQELRSTFN